jgi:hypothetical protein
MISLSRSKCWLTLFSGIEFNRAERAPYPSNDSLLSLFIGKVTEFPFVSKILV